MWKRRVVRLTESEYSHESLRLFLAHRLRSNSIIERSKMLPVVSSRNLMKESTGDQFVRVHCKAWNWNELGNDGTTRRE